MIRVRRLGGWRHECGCRFSWSTPEKIWLEELFGECGDGDVLRKFLIHFALRADILLSHNSTLE